MHDEPLSEADAQAVMMAVQEMLNDPNRVVESPRRVPRRIRRCPLLPAFADEKLSVEGAEQLVRMAEDETVTTARGQDLPLADRDALMNAAKERLERRHD